MVKQQCIDTTAQYEQLRLAVSEEKLRQRLGQQPQRQRRQHPEDRLKPEMKRRQRKYADRFDGEDVAIGDAILDDDYNIQRKRMNKKKRSDSTSSDALYDERPVSDLKGQDLEQFNSWITESIDTPPVAGAGAAKRIPDNDLRMFRNQRHRVKYPPLVIAEVKELGQSFNRRPRTWESSPPPRKTARVLLEAELKAKVSSHATFTMLPRLKSPPRLSKEKATMTQLLSECKAKAEGFLLAPEPVSSYDNQHSSRKEIDADDIGELIIPDEVFYEQNSFVGLRKVDLSDWTGLCAEANPVFVQISQKLSSRCTDLNLSGLTAVYKPTDFHMLLEQCCNLKRLDLSCFESIQKAAFGAMARKCPVLEHLSVAESDSVTDDLATGIASSFRNLTSLNLAGCYHLTDASVKILSKKLNSLRRLRIDHCSLLSDAALIPFSKAHGQELRELSICDCDKVTDRTIKELFAMQPTQLEELNISRCVAITDASIEFLTTVPSYSGDRSVSLYRRLTTLDVSGCPLLTSLCCSFIASSCPFLKSFKAANCVKICDKGILALADLAQLEELDLLGCCRITDTGLDKFFRTSGTRSTSTSLEVVGSGLKQLKYLSLADCAGVGEKALLAIIDTCAASLVTLDITRTAPLSTSILIKLVKKCRLLSKLFVRAQSSMTRAVLAHLATSNKCLEIFDIRDCSSVDDLALYPLLVMRSLRELYLTGCLSITSRGLQSLPPDLVHLDLQGPVTGCDQMNDEGCRILTTRLHMLERLDLSYQSKVTAVGAAELLTKCKYLYSLNLFNCEGIQLNHLSRIMNTYSHNNENKYGLQIIADEEMKFSGIGVQDMVGARKARHREKILVAYKKQQHAARTIQMHFRSRNQFRVKRLVQEEREWKEFCGAVDIQRIFRGYQSRKTYKFVQQKVTNAVVFLQYKWRSKLQLRRVRKACAYWTKVLEMKMFRSWKYKYQTSKQEKERAKASVKAAKALGFWGERTVAKLFVSWRQYVQKKTVRAKKVIGFWKCQSMPRIIVAWRSYTIEERRRRLLLTHVFLNTVELETHNSSIQLEKTKRANSVVKKLIWRLWRDFVMEQKRFLLKATLSIISGGLLHWSFRQWRQSALHEKQIREKNRKILLKIFHRAKTQVWNAWQEFVHEQKAKKRALFRFSNNIQTKCWIKWKQFHTELQHLRSISGRMVGRLRLMNAARAVTTWYEFTQEQIALRNSKRRALAYFTNASLVRIFNAWAGYAEYVKMFRARMKIRMENSALVYTLISWMNFTQNAKYRHFMATRIQAFWRGCAQRREVEDLYLYRMWATVLIQNAWRGRLGRAILRSTQRKARLREYLRAERERDAMDAEEQAMHKYNRDIDRIVLLQRQWRGVAARHLFTELRRAKFILKKQQEAEMQEILRVEARKRQLEHIQKEKLRHLAAIEIQRHIRGYLARHWYQTQQEFLYQQRCAMRVQAVYRGRISRRRTSALRRSYITRMEILARRAVEGKILRTLGAKTRSTQGGLRRFLDFFGLDPATFLLDIRTVLKEVKEDFMTLKNFFEVLKTKVDANAAQSPPALPGKLPFAKTFLQKTDVAKKFLSDMEQIVNTTNIENEQEKQTIKPGQAVRIVLRGHSRCGETALVLSVRDDVAQVKMDVDGELEFFPLMVPATKVEPAKYVLHKVPELAFSAAYTTTVNGKINVKWRQQLEAYAMSIASESRRFCAARIIQCAARVYLARMAYQRELELQGINAARRQEALLRILKMFRCANTRIANILVQLHLIRPQNVPPNLPDEALEIQKCINRFQRMWARRSEIQQTFFRLVPVEYKGEGDFHGQMLPVPYARVLDKLLHYPFQWLQRVTCVPIAQRLEKQGMAELAAFLGGGEFAKSFEEKHADAREHFFAQLVNCVFCASEGWALVHGVFQKRKLAVNYPSLYNSSKKPRPKTKLVPHGWGVAHFLTGQVGRKWNWLERNSIEAQFKSLQFVKALKQKEREERLESQILARQGTLNTLRSTEGARGYAKRHAELSNLEEKTKSFFKRYQDEIVWRDKEEAKLFEEEIRLNALVAAEKAELDKQGQHLNELQQQVPDSVVEIQMVMSSKTALEFLVVGCHIEVEYDDENWYTCEIKSLDCYVTCTAEIVYLDDGRKEKIKLIEAPVQDEKQFQKQFMDRRRTVAEITAAAAARAEAQGIAFRRWRAGKAVDILWETPLDNGTPITQYIVEWKDETDDTITGKSIISSLHTESTPRTTNDSARASTSVAPAPTKTTLWPILPQSESTLRIRIAAENKKGVGLPSVYKALPEELTDVSYETAVILTYPPVDTSPLEARENAAMVVEDCASLEFLRQLTCTICHTNFPSEPNVHEHMCRNHAIPLICPFRSCQQVCASERALRYHIWRCSVPKPTVEERTSEIFMEIFNISRQYCMRKPRRHTLATQNAMTEPGNEESFLESKYQEARSAWFVKGKEMHEKRLKKNALLRKRDKHNRYEPPQAIYGVDFADPELNVARRKAVLSAIGILQADLDAYILETNTQMDQLRHEEKELLDYIALKVKRIKATDEEWQKQSLKREKKKATKSLEQAQEKIAHLIEVSTQAINKLKDEIQRLTTIEKAFLPFTHQVVKLMRLSELINETLHKSNTILDTHTVILDHFQEDLRKLMVRAQKEVEGLEAWDAMIEARRKQLDSLKEELRRLQVMHVAEMQGYRQKRDEGEEVFELTKLRQGQAKILTRRERAEKELLAVKRTRADAAAAARAAENTIGSMELTTPVKSLQIANHDLQMYEKFIMGKSDDVEYLREDQSQKETLPPKSGPDNTSSVSTVVTQASTEVTGHESSQQPGERVIDSSSDALTEEKLSSRKMKNKAKPKALHELPHTYRRLECNFQDGFICGHVLIEYNDGSIYEGPWVEDSSYDKPINMEPMKTRFTPNHWGKFTYRDGTIWEGEDVDNFFSPFTATGPNFLITTPEKNRYSGSVRMGKYHGFGTLEINTFAFSKGQFVGEWCEGKRHGYGIERFDFGEVYEGYWEFDRYHGEGEIVYDDSSRYEGSFRYGQWHGSGIRTLENGDRIIGTFEEGFLNGPGIMEFADKRHYHGEFLKTRRHGMGVLTFPNGDRYEGPFVNDVQHGEGKFFTKSTSESGGEPLVRIGKWVDGERTAWLSRPSTQLATSTFIQYFAVIQKVNSEVEMDLIPAKFTTPYAVMVASMLPHLPEGVDANDGFVKIIVNMLAKTQNIMIGADVLEKTIADHTAVQQQLTQETALAEKIRNDVDKMERELRGQTRHVQELRDELDEKTTKELEMQVKLENFWKHDTSRREDAYKRAVDGLRDLDVMDWYKLRTAKLDNVYMSLLEAFCILLNFTSNYYLAGKPYKPTTDDVVKMISSSEDNVRLGDREGLIHKYDVKALYILPLFDVYSFGEGTRSEMLHSITQVIHHPQLRPNNFRLYQISPAFTAVCMWVRAAYFYAKKASEIYPVMKRVMEQLVVLEKLRQDLANAQAELDQKQRNAEQGRQLFETQIALVEQLKQRENELQHVIQGIEELDRSEMAPLEKKRIKRPQTFRPASAGATPVSAGDEDGNDSNKEGNGEGSERKKQQQEVELGHVNHRQVFEVNHSSDSTDDDAKKKVRQSKEQVLMRIFANPELAEEFEVLKKEVRKVINHGGGKVLLSEFPIHYEQQMLKPLDPTVYGIKKLKTLLTIMDDVCLIVEPQAEGEVETVQLFIEEDSEPMLPRLPFFCRTCPGMSFETKSELVVHEKTKWHFWNLQAKRAGQPPTKWTLASTLWSEVYDDTDGAICYYNKLTGDIVKHGDPPREMQANEIMMELLADEDDTKESNKGEDGKHQVREEKDERMASQLVLQEENNSWTEVEEHVADTWEEVADEHGNVYFYNHMTGESSWVHPKDNTTAVTISSFSSTVDDINTFLHSDEMHQ